MTLATKLAFGFGMMVVIAGILGFVGWRGLAQMSANVELDKQGSDCLDVLNTCALLRRDFAAKGFAKADNETKNAAEQWEEAYALLQKSLEGLKNADGMSAENRNRIGAAEVQAKSYKQAFDKQVVGRQTMDDAFAVWSKVGWSVTSSVKTLLDEVVTPARKAAIESADFAAVEKWSGIALGLDEHIVQPFLLLRVNAVYLIATKADEQWEGYQKQLQSLKASAAQWTTQVKGNQALEAVATEIAGYITQYEQAGAAFYQGVTDTRTANEQMASSAGEVVGTVETLKASLVEEMQAVTARSTTMMTAGATAGVIFGILLAVLLTRSIAGPINRSVASLAEGAYMVSEAIGQINASATHLADASTQQASSLEETSAAMEEMAAMTRTNVDNAKQASELVKVTHHAAYESDKEMVRLNEAMNAINESSGQISKIIKVIEEIAFQTNLLALNAAVEAARAGEHGKGFAVVADEVRNLAQRAAQAAGETTSLIETSVARAREGTEVAGGFGKALSSIVESVTKVSTLVDGIAMASDEQAQGVSQINTAIGQMDRVTQSLAASAEESAAAVEELSAQAGAVSQTSRDLAAVVGSKQALMGRSHAAATVPPIEQGHAVTQSMAPQAQAAKPPVARAKPSQFKAPAPQATASKAPTTQEGFIPLDDDDSVAGF
jgi:methyl-accepting chemotaxis protein